MPPGPCRRALSTGLGAFRVGGTVEVGFKVRRDLKKEELPSASILAGSDMRS